MPKAKEAAPTIEQPVAPVHTQYAPPPRSPERHAGGTTPLVHHYPEIRSGVCEWCGIINDKLPSTEQYKLCPHFNFLRGGELKCSYCPMERDQHEVVRLHKLNVYDSPFNSTELVIVCDDYECTRKHQARFTSNRTS